MAVESCIFAGQLLTHWRREGVVPIQALLYPTFLLITYYLLVGKSIIAVTGTDSLYGLVPACSVAGALFGALASGMSIPAERESGLLSQLWALPVNRASALSGRLLAEAARTLTSTALITTVGIVLGLRFRNGWLAVVPFVFVPVMVVSVFSMAVVAIAVRAKSSTALIWLGVPSTAAVLASSGAPPIGTLPSWLQPVVRFQPLSSPIESMRALAYGDPALWPLVLSVLWVLGLAAVLGPLAVRGYRAAAEFG